MKLSTLDYREFSDNDTLWDVEDLSFVNINLIVGKNAIGKSRLLRVINGLAQLINGVISPSTLYSGYYKVVFVDDGIKSKRHRDPMPEIIYEIEMFKNKVQKERLIVGGVLKLDRGVGGRGLLVFEEQEGKGINVNVPESTLAVSARRDAVQHPFFEALHDWAKGNILFQFANDNSKQLAIADSHINAASLPVEWYVDAPLQGRVKIAKEKFGRSFEAGVVADMRRMGFMIENFGITSQSGVDFPLAPAYSEGNGFQVLFVQEDGIPRKIRQEEMSNGMFRSLSILVVLHIVRLAKVGGCILIDDIGEGCDFDRATKLIEIVTEWGEQGFIQLIMSSNDRFVMNGVSLDYWCLIQRDGSHVRAFNKRNSKEIFEDFEEYGFSNFDFFARGVLSGSNDSVFK